MKIVDNATSVSEQWRLLLNAKISVQIYMDSRPLLDTLGSMSQVAEKVLRQSVVYL